MKNLALVLLVAAALLAALAHAMRGAHPAWGYVSAFAEAAMVGALADWFAVVALFRRPLGLPIPHTAIIPENKDRIGQNLADFLCDHFLSSDLVLERLRALDLPTQMAGWLARPANAARLGDLAAAYLGWALSALDDARVRAFAADLARAGLEHVDVARLSGRLLEGLTSEDKHQALLDAALVRLAEVLAHEETQRQITQFIADEIARESRAMRMLGLDQPAARAATRRLIQAIARTLADMAADPVHPLRLRFDGFAASLTSRLLGDPDLQARAEALKRELIDNPAVADYAGKLWTELLQWLRADLMQPDSALRARIAGLAEWLGRRLSDDADMRAWMQSQLLAAAPPLIARYREDIRHYVAERVRQWDARELTAELERQIGRDLQFIRINGTVVGGLAGLAMYALSRLAG